VAHFVQSFGILLPQMSNACLTDAVATIFNIETKVEVLQTDFANGIFPAEPVVNDVHSLAKFGVSNRNCKKRRTWTAFVQVVC
jgi:hypothetical protein